MKTPVVVRVAGVIGMACPTPSLNSNSTMTFSASAAPGRDSQGQHSLDGGSRFIATTGAHRPIKESSTSDERMMRVGQFHHKRLEQTGSPK